eukprot:4196038-Lingulodinium_polyedra.AAC.1
MNTKNTKLPVGSIAERFPYFIRVAKGDVVKTGVEGLKQIINDLEDSTFEPQADKDKIHVLQQFLKLAPASMGKKAKELIKEFTDKVSSDISKLATKAKKPKVGGRGA